LGNAVQAARFELLHQTLYAAMLADRTFYQLKRLGTNGTTQHAIKNSHRFLLCAEPLADAARQISVSAKPI
jgi:hypothetical protein